MKYFSIFTISRILEKLRQKVNINLMFELPSFSNSFIGMRYINSLEPVDFGKWLKIGKNDILFNFYDISGIWSITGRTITWI